MITTAVDRGIREMEEDPKRSVRRLADLGSMFSKSRFQRSVFRIIQEVLSNENSAYYDMIGNLLGNADHNALKTFGVNMGYLSWVYGGRKLHELERQDGQARPMTMMFRYDPAGKDGLDVQTISALVKQGQKMGIYSCYIRQMSSGADNYDLLSLFSSFPDVAFVWLRDSGCLTAAQIEILRGTPGTVVSLPVEDPESVLTAGLLRDQKLLFAMHMTYHGDPRQEMEQLTEYRSRLTTAQCSLFVLLQADDSSFSAAKWCYDERLRQDLPVFVYDYYGDSADISGRILEHETLFELDTDGTVLQPAAARGRKVTGEDDLGELFSQIMPAVKFREADEEPAPRKKKRGK